MERERESFSVVTLLINTPNVAHVLFLMQTFALKVLIPYIRSDIGGITSKSKGEIIY